MIALLAWLACGWPTARLGDPRFPTVPAPEPTADTGPVWPVLPDVPVPGPGDVLFAADRPVAITLDGLPTRDVWVPAVVEVEGFPAREARVRHKGQGSYDPARPSLRVDLDPYDEGENLDGQRVLVLNNMRLDPSGIREPLAYAAFRSVGVPAPRTTWAPLSLDGVDLGRYVMVEEVDEAFLARWFGDGSGPLYEIFDVDLDPVGVLLLDHDGGPDQRASITRIARILEAAPEPLLPALEPWLDVEGWMACWASSAVIGQFDAYPYSSPGDDLYLYVHPDDGRVHLVPHGADETFRDLNRPVDYVFGLLARACLDDRACEDRFEAEVWRALDALEAEGLDALALDLASQRDPAELTVRGDVGLDEVAASVDEVLGFLRERRAALERMPGLEGP